MSRISEYRRETILNAALEEFSRRGVAGASISDIAARAGIGKSTVYEYFASKSELLLAACGMKTRQVSESARAIFTTDEPFPQQLTAYMRLLSCLGRDADVGQFLRLLNEDNVLDGFRDAVLHLWDDLADAMESALARARDRGEVRADLDLKPTAVYLLSLPNPPILARLAALGEADPPAALARLALKGVCP